MSISALTNWSFISGGVTAPFGFRASGVKAGLKNSKNFDLALLLAPDDSLCTGTFTQSSIRAKCIELCLERLKSTDGKTRAVLINSGQANACTGNRGLEDSLLATSTLANQLDIPLSQVLICSTGVIGVPICMQNLLKALDPLIRNLSTQGGSNAAQAILTTDLVKKEIAVEAVLGNRSVRIGGMAKGSGMIHPDMATMLGFLTCDASMPKELWDAMIKRVVDNSFNSISVDGDTSTNDAVLAFCSGDPISKEHFQDIENGLSLVATFLAKSIARDGEGANCLIEVNVEGANTIEEARLIAKTICSSSLVKTAVHGFDPNWGRIIAAAGRSGIAFNEKDLSLWIGSFQLLHKGLPKEFDRNSAKKYMKDKLISTNDDHTFIKETINIRLIIGKGQYSSVSWGCDLSEEYVRINADYTT